MSETDQLALLVVVKNWTKLALLEREAEWRATHHDVGNYCGSKEKGNECDSCYSGDTDWEHTHIVNSLVMKLFNKEVYPE